jgi:Protein of unknown function (DUF4238)
MVARRHHYLPRCYLKGFSKPRERGKWHYVHVYDRSGETFKANIINIATQKDFNRVEIEGHPPDAFEQGVLAKFENELGPALVRILEHRSLKDDADRALLFNLIGMSAIRTPRHRETLRDFHEQIAHMIMDLATATKERWEGQTRQMKAEGHVSKRDVPYEEMRAAVVGKKFRIQVPTERHIEMEMNALDAVLPTLFKRKWVVLLPPMESPGFVTCDHPVCLMFSDPKMRGKFKGPGHGLAGTQLIFPIGTHMAVVGAYEIEEGTLKLNEDRVAGVNGALVTYADRQVYAANPDFTYVRQENEKPRRGSSLIKDIHFRRNREKGVAAGLAKP